VSDRLQFANVDEALAKPTASLRRLNRLQLSMLMCEWAAWVGEFSRSVRVRSKSADFVRSYDPTDSDRWVYFIRQGTEGPIKIGISDDVARRVSTLQSCNPFPLHCVVAIPGSLALEFALHQVFSESRLHGEWFAPTGALIKLIELALNASHTAGVTPESI
jgi:hypothetical protein